MADRLFFSRETKLYLGNNGVFWEIPVLDGFSFSQSINTSEVTLSEMSDTAGTSRRGRRMFNDSLAPAEWSFTTYARPFASTSGASGTWETSAGITHAVEEALWAHFVSQQPNGWSGASWDDGITNTTSGMWVDFTGSNKTTLGTFDLYFTLGGCSTDGFTTIYKLANSVVNSVNIEFDIEGITSISWNGFSNTIDDLGVSGGIAGVPEYTYPIAEAISSTDNFIRNRLTSLAITANNTSVFPGAVGNSGIYNVVLTGGSLNFENNITFLTPEELCRVNYPIGHVTGNRNINGNFTCYLNSAGAGSTADLFDDLANATSIITNSFNLLFSIGGAGTPRIEVAIPTAHLEIPSHSIEDVISLEVNFHALPTTLDETNEAVIKYVAP